MRRDHLSLKELIDTITAHGFAVTQLPAPSGMDGLGGYEIIAQGVYNGQPMTMRTDVPCIPNTDYTPFLDLFYETLLSIPDAYIHQT